MVFISKPLTEGFKTKGKTVEFVLNTHISIVRDNMTGGRGGLVQHGDIVLKTLCPSKDFLSESCEL